MTMVMRRVHRQQVKRNSKANRTVPRCKNMVFLGTRLRNECTHMSPVTHYIAGQDGIWDGRPVARWKPWTMAEYRCCNGAGGGADRGGQYD